ncbi:MAG: SRPBCC domain-containing protein [Anaerolineales bacterium]|jgi:uncharacterized protein YndB with AHSA1/START domain
MTIEFEISTLIPATAGQIYDAWLDSEAHTRMTGGKAQVSAQVGGEFTAWDGYIHGKNLALEPGRRILQAWRTADFAEDDEDSLLEVIFEPEADGTRVRLRHSHLPDEDGSGYEQGWVLNYFEPMKDYFLKK